MGFKSSLTQLLTTIAAVLLVGCSKGWILDYHEPAEQFLATKDVAIKAKPYVVRHLKITIKGIVSKVDVSNTLFAFILEVFMVFECIYMDH